MAAMEASINVKDGGFTWEVDCNAQGYERQPGLEGRRLHHLHKAVL